MTRVFHMHAQHAPSEICFCPRCRHAVRFEQAPSDGAYVCQRCLRYRINVSQMALQCQISAIVRKQDDSER